MNNKCFLIRHVTSVALLLLLLANGRASAEPVGGVVVTVWDNATSNNQFNSSPPLPPTTLIAGVVSQQQVFNNFDSQPLFGLRDDFVVRYEGNITTQTTTVVRLRAIADDGTVLILNGQTITNDWYDKGNGGSISAPIQFVANVPQSFTLWFYENGGGAWVQLWWFIDNQWSVVPASAFTEQSASPTSTVDTTPTQTSPPTIQTTTTMQVVQTTPSTLQEATTTTTEQQTETTSPTSSAYQPTTSTSVPQMTTTTASNISNVDDFIPPTLAATTTVVESTTTTQQTSVETLPQTTSTTIQSEIPQDGSNAPEAVLNALVGGVSKDEAKSLVLDADNISDLNSEQADAIFDALVLDELNETELAVLVANVQIASDVVRKSFEKKQNVFGGQVDSYVPLGSNVPVSTRRVLIAATVALSAVPMSTRKS